MHRLRRRHAAGSARGLCDAQRWRPGCERLQRHSAQALAGLPAASSCRPQTARWDARAAASRSGEGGACGAAAAWRCAQASGPLCASAGERRKTQGSTEAVCREANGGANARPPPPPRLKERNGASRCHRGRPRPSRQRVRPCPGQGPRELSLPLAADPGAPAPPAAPPTGACRAAASPPVAPGAGTLARALRPAPARRTTPGRPAARSSGEQPPLALPCWPSRPCPAGCLTLPHEPVPALPGHGPPQGGCGASLSRAPQAPEAAGRRLSEPATAKSPPVATSRPSPSRPRRRAPRPPDRTRGGRKCSSLRTRGAGRGAVAANARLRLTRPLTGALSDRRSWTRSSLRSSARPSASSTLTVPVSSCTLGGPAAVPGSQARSPSGPIALHWQSRWRAVRLLAWRTPHRRDPGPCARTSLSLRPRIRAHPPPDRASAAIAIWTCGCRRR